MGQTEGNLYSSRLDFKNDLPLGNTSEKKAEDLSHQQLNPKRSQVIDYDKIDFKIQQPAAK